MRVGDPSGRVSPEMMPRAVAVAMALAICSMLISIAVLMLLGSAVAEE